METRIIKATISRDDLRVLAQAQYQDMVKAVVDVEQKIVGVGGEFHIDIQSLMVEQEQARGDTTWGINLYVNKTGDDFIEFDSMINLKPLLGNRTRNVESEEIREQIKGIVQRLFL